MRVFSPYSHQVATAVGTLPPILIQPIDCAGAAVRKASSTNSMEGAVARVRQALGVQQHPAQQLQQTLDASWAAVAGSDSAALGPVEVLAVLRSIVPGALGRGGICYCSSEPLGSSSLFTNDYGW